MCKKRNIAIFSVIVLLLMLTIVGSIWDYEIANGVYIGQTASENFFGILFAFIGIIPTFVGWSFLGSSIICLAKKQVENMKKRRWLISFAVLLFVLAFFYFCNTLMLVNANVFSVHWAIAYPIGIVVLVGAGFLGYRLSEKSDNPKLLQTVLLLAVSSLIAWALIAATKGIMDRPRFRFVLENANAEYFRSWWQSGSALKSSLMVDAAGDEFSSFPSGHSAYAMFAIFLFPALADYIPRLEKHRILLTIGGLIWWALTAYSRLTIGAHYLTDVCIAGLITISAYAIAKLVRSKIVKSKS